MPQKKLGATSSVRIIGGKWKRSVITFSDAEGLRPTPDRVRETVFNWLGQDLSGLSVLDAFAGTGAFALEAASRGAARVVALDTNATNVRTITEHAKRLGGAEVVRALRTDALNYMNTCGAAFDIVFCDPPFSGELYPKVAQIARQVLSAQGFFYLEAPDKFEIFGGLLLHKHLRAGAVNAHLFVHPHSAEIDAGK